MQKLQLDIGFFGRTERFCPLCCFFPIAGRFSVYQGVSSRGGSKIIGIRLCVQNTDECGKSKNGEKIQFRITSFQAGSTALLDVLHTPAEPPGNIKQVSHNEEKKIKKNNIENPSSAGLSGCIQTGSKHG